MMKLKTLLKRIDTPSEHSLMGLYAGGREGVIISQTSNRQLLSLTISPDTSISVRGVSSQRARVAILRATPPLVALNPQFSNHLQTKQTDGYLLTAHTGAHTREGTCIHDCIEPQ